MAEGGTLRELLAVFGFEVDARGLEKGESALDSFFGKVKTLAAGLAGAFAVKEIGDFAEHTAKAMTAIERQATQLGISTDKVQEFQFAAKSLGLEGDQLVNLMGRLQVAQQGAAAGSKQGAGAFKALGVNVKDANGHFKSADELFLDVAEGISKVKDPSKQAAVAVQLFGRQGRTLLPFLKEGRKGAAELGKEFRSLGGGYTKEAIEKAKEYERESAKLDLTLTGLKNGIASALIPIVSKVIGWFAKAVHWFSELTKNTELVKAALVILTGVAAYFAVSMAIAFAPVLLGVAALVALAAIIDDIIVLFEGGQSVIGAALDALFGKGASTDIVNGLKAAWASVTTAIKEGYDWLIKNKAAAKELIDEVYTYSGLKFGVKAVKYVSNKVADLADEQAQVNNAKIMAQYSFNPPTAPASPRASQVSSSNSSTVILTAPITINAGPGHDEKKMAHAVKNELKSFVREARAPLPQAGGGSGQ